MLVFSVYIPSLISRVRPVHSFFEKKSILENPSQIFTNLFFNAYLGKYIDEFCPDVGRDDATANFVTHWSPMLFDSQCGLSPIFSMIIHTKNAYLTKYKLINE